MSACCPIHRRSFVALAAAALLAIAALPTQVLAQDAAALRLHSLAAMCAQCHGTDGRVFGGSLVPPLAGMPAAQFVERMQTFKAADARASLMPQLARGFSDAQIAQLAAYFAAQSP